MARNIIGYTVNVGKSIAYSAADRVKDIMPNTGDFIQTNSELYNTVYNDIRNYRVTYKRTMDAFKRTKVYEAGDALKKNLFEDIKTGKFYNKKRQEDAENAMVGLDDGFSDGMDSYDSLDDGWDEDATWEDSGDTGEDGESESELNARAVGMSVAKTGEYIVENQKMNTNLLYNQNMKNAKMVEKHMGTINDNIGQLVPMAGITKIMAENQQKFYENTGKILNDMLSLMRGMNERLAKAYPDAVQTKEKTKSTRYGDIVMNGMPDIKAYGKTILDNVKNQGGMITSALDMFGEDSWKMLVSSPLMFLPSMVVNKMVPKTIEKNLQSLDKSISGIFSSILMRFNKMANDYENPIMQAIGRTFGVRNNVKGAPDLSYEKGKVDFNGMHGKALTEVIPTYLRKILSAITGKDELVFDFKKGSFVNGYQVKKSYENSKNSYADNATSNMREEMEKSAESFTFNSPKEKKKFKENMRDILREIYSSGEIFDVNSKDDMQYMDYGVDKKTFQMFKALFKSVDKNKQLTFNNDIMEGRETQNQFMENLAKNNELMTNIFNGSLLNDAIDRDKVSGRLKERTSGYYKMSPLNMKDNLGNSAFYYLQTMTKELSVIRANIESPIKFGNGNNNGFGGNYGGGEGGSYDRPQDYTPDRYKTKQVKEGGIYKTIYIRRSINDINIKDNTPGRLSSLDIAKREQREKEQFLKSEKSRIEKAPKNGIINVSDLDEDAIERNLNNALGTMKTHRKILDARRRDKPFLQRVLEGERIPDKIKNGYDAISEFFTKPMDVVNNVITKVDTRLYQMIYGSKENGKDIKGMMDLMIFKAESKIGEFSNFMYEKVLNPLSERFKVDKLKELRDDLLEKMGITDIGTKIKTFLFGEKDEDGYRTTDGIFSKIGDSIKKTFGGVWDTVKDSVKTSFSPITSKFKRVNRYSALDDMNDQEIEYSNKNTKESRNVVENRLNDVFGNMNNAQYVSRRGKTEKEMRTLYNDSNIGNIDYLQDQIRKIELTLRGNIDPETKTILNKRLSKLKSILKDAKKNQTAKIRRDRLASKNKSVQQDPLDSILAEEKQLEEERIALEKEGIDAFTNAPYELLKNKKKMQNKVNFLGDKVNSKYLKDEYIRNHGSLEGFEEYYQKLSDRYINAKETLEGPSINNIYNKKKSDFSRKRNDFDKRYQEFLGRKNGSSNNNVLPVVSNIDPNDIHTSVTRIGDLSDTTKSKAGLDPSSYEGKTISLLEKINSGIDTIVNGVKSIKPNNRGPVVPFDIRQEAALGDIRTDHEPSESHAANTFSQRLAQVIAQFMHGNINFFNKGSDMIQESQVAVVGKGEAIVPAETVEVLKKIVGEAKTGITGNKKLSSVANNTEARIKAILKNVPDEELESYLDEIRNQVHLSSRNMNIGTSAKLDLVSKKIISNVRDDKKNGERKSEAAGLAGEIVNELMNGIKVTKDTLFGSDPEKEKKDFGLVVDDVTKHLGDYLPDAISGGLVGSGISLLTGAIGGPLLGAAAGAGISIAKNSETMQEWLFGKKDDQGKRDSSGVISKDFLDKINRYLPDLKTYGITGGIAGLAPFMPFGPITGIMLGGAFSYAKNNKDIQDRLFGENGLLGKDWKDKVKKKLPKIGAGALAGALIGGPFGILGNALLGSGVGFLTTTNTFTEVVLGKKNTKTGKWEGGLLSSLNNTVIEPLKVSASGFKDRVWKYIEEDIFAPLKKAKDPLFNQVKLFFRSITDNTKKFLEGMFERNVGIPLKKLIDEKLGKFVTFGKKWVIDPIVGGLKNTIAAPFKAIGLAGEAARRKDIKRGQASYMTAKDRLQYRKDHNTWNFTGGDRVQDFDQILANLSEQSPEMLSQLRETITEMTMNQKDLKAKRKDMRNTLGSNLMDHYGSKDTKAIMTMIKKGDIDGATKSIVSNSKISAADREVLQRQIQNYGNYLGDDISMTKRYQEADKLLKDKFGIKGLKGLDRRDLLANLDKEINENKNKKPQLTPEQKDTKDFRSSLLDKMQEVIDSLHGVNKEASARKAVSDSTFSTEYDSDGNEIERDQNGFKFTIDKNGKKRLDRKDLLTRQLIKEKQDAKRSIKNEAANEWHNKRQQDLEEAFGTETFTDKAKKLGAEATRKTAGVTGTVGDILRGTGGSVKSTLGAILGLTGSTAGALGDYKNILGFKVRNGIKDFKAGYNGEGDNKAGKGLKDLFTRTSDSLSANIGKVQNFKDAHTEYDENGSRRFKLNRQGEQIEDMGDAETVKTERAEAKDKKAKSTLTQKMLGFFKRQEDDDKDDEGNKKKKGIFGKILGAITFVGGMFKNLFGGLTGGVGKLLGATKLGKIGGPVIGVLSKLGPLGAIAGVAAGGLALANADKLFDFWDNKVAPWITEKAVPWITKTAIPALGKGVSVVVSKLPGLMFSAITKGIPAVGKLLWNISKAIIGGIVNGTGRFIEKGISHLKNLIMHPTSAKKRNAANKTDDVKINQKYDSLQASNDKLITDGTNSTGDNASDGTYTAVQNISDSDVVYTDSNVSDAYMDTVETNDGPTVGNTAKVLARNVLTGGATGNLGKIGSTAGKIFKGAGKFANYAMHPFKTAGKGLGAVIKAGSNKILGEEATKSLGKGLNMARNAGNAVLHPFKTASNVIKDGFKATMTAGREATEITSKTGKVLNFAGDLSTKLGNTFSNIATKVGGKVKGMESLAKDAVQTNSGLVGKTINAGMDLAQPILENIKTFLNKILTNGVVQKLIGGDKVKVLLSKIVPDVIQKISKKLAQNTAKLTAKVAAAASSGGLLNIAWAVADFVSGYRNAKEILGITQDPSFGMKIGCGLLKAFNGLFIILSFIPESTWVNIFVDGILPLFGQEDSELQKMRKDARAEVDKYNQETGQDLSQEEYNKMVESNKPGMFTKAKNAVVNIAGKLGSKIKSSASWVMNGVKNIGTGISNAASWVGNKWNNLWGNNTSNAEGGWNGQGGYNSNIKSLLYPKTKLFKGKGGQPSFDEIPKGTSNLAAIYSQADIDKLFQDYSSKYGVDPDIAKALSMQESGGDPNNSNGAALGLMQIEKGGTTDEFIKYGQDTFGQSWSAGDRADPSKAIPFGLYRLGNDLKYYNGDYLKTLQAYNFSHYSLDALIKATGDQWWENRKNVGQYNGTGLSSYGDPQYVEHVLRYYKGGTPSGSGATGTGTSSTETSSVDQSDPISSLMSIFQDGIKSFYGINTSSNSTTSSASGSGVTASGDVGKVIQSAQSKLGDPYVWGGTGETLTEDKVNSFVGTDHDISKASNWKEWIGKPGYDCSGLMQAAYKENGINIGRTTYDQIKNGTSVPIGEQRASDLMLFGSTGNPHHVGMSLGNGTFIEAPSSGKAIRISPDSSRSDLCAVRRIIDSAASTEVSGSNQVSDGDNSGASSQEGGVGGFYSGKGGFADQFFSNKLGGNLTSGFGRRDPIGKVVSANHTGIDIGAAEGKNIPSPVNGTVVRKSGRGGSNGLGNMVVIRDGKGGEHYFGHMKGESNLALGSKVKSGETIGHVGNTGNSTGSHLHYETRINNIPVNPNKYLGQGGIKLPDRSKELDNLKKMEEARNKKGMGGETDILQSSNNSITTILNSMLSVLTTMQQDTSNLGAILQLMNKILDLKTGNNSTDSTTQYNGQQKENTRKQLIETAKNQKSNIDPIQQLTNMVSKLTGLATE